MAVEQPASRTPDKKSPRWRQEPKITPLPKPLQPPTAEEAEAANRGDYREDRITGFIKKHPLISSVAAAGIAATAAYETAPAFHQAVDSTYHDIMQRLGVEIVVPPSFNNKAGEGALGDNNIHAISKEEAKSLNLQPVGTDTTLTFLFPFQLPPGAKIQYERGIGIPEPGPAEMLPTEDRKSQEEAVAKYKEFKRKGIRSEIDFVLPKDTIIIAPIDAHVSIGYGIPSLNPDQDSTKGYGMVLIYYSQQENITYVIKIFNLDNNTGMDVIEKLPRFDDNKYFSGVGWKELPEVEKGKPLLRTTADSQTLALTIEAYEGDKKGLGTKAMSVVTPQFLTTTDTGNQKLLVLEK